MRTLQILHSRGEGGTQILAEIIGAELASRGNEVEIAYLFPTFRAGLLSKLRGVVAVVSRILCERHDVIMAYQPTASILTGFLGWIARCPSRIVHQTALPAEVKAPMRWLDRAIGTLGLYTANIANSHSTSSAFAHYPAQYRQGMILIEHGIPIPRSRQTRANTLAQLGVPDKGRILLNVGRLTSQKNQSVLIRALTALPRHRLVVAGDGPDRFQLETLALRLGVADRMHLLGEVAHGRIADLLAACDVFVFPSTWETFGLAVVEAGLSELPLVVADLPVLREVLSADGAAAASFVVSSDPEAWVQGILQSEAVNDLQCKMAAHAIARKYSVGKMMKAYAALLQSEPF
ncbi:MAG: hypothetical protein QOF09_3072 [Alphaproteobacteria bacterium]|jgi:glycosyltransferase involved in cell wall biosynthesis|nr:hypothetical protein [Alphaproteobacteria bacterium]